MSAYVLPTNVLLCIYNLKNKKKKKKEKKESGKEKYTEKEI